MALEFMRKKGEDLTEYLIRLYENREKYGLSNQEVADLLNREEDVNYDESKWRKEFQAWKNRFEEYVSKSFHNADEYNQNILDKYEMLRIEAKKQEIRYKDQKNEYTKLIRNSARFETLRDVLREEVQSLPTNYSLNPIVSDEENEIVLLISDWHVGSQHHGSYNTYNLEVFEERLDTLIKKIHLYLDKTPTNKIHIANLGDMVSGLLHQTNRIEANTHVINQVKIASESIAKLVSSVADRVENVEYYSVFGNHSRVSADKAAISANDESFEKLIHWFLELRLAEYNNINMHMEQDGFIESKVCGETVIYAHGDFDKRGNVTKLGAILKKHISMVFLGHTHNSFTEQQYSTKLIVNPSLMGADLYSTQGRFGNQVAQTIINVCVTPEGIDEEVKVLNL